MSENIQPAESNKTAEFGDYRDFIPELKELEEIVEETSTPDNTQAEDADGREASSDKEENTDAGDEKAPEGESAPEEVKSDELASQAKATEEKIKVLETELLEARQQLEKAQPIQLSATPDNPFANADTPEQLAQRVEEARKVWRWASENPDGATYTTAAGQEVDVTPEQMRKMRLDAEEAMRFHAPHRADYLQRRDQYDVQAKEAYPELFQAGSEQSAKLRELISVWPEIARFPDKNLVLGDYMRGRAAREAAKTAKEQQRKSVPKAKIPLAPPIPQSRGTARFSDSKSTLKKVEQRLLTSSGDEDSLAEFYVTKATANNS
jgi:hypothetical protein